MQPPTMASTSTHIRDMAAALREGKIPGAMNAKRTIFTFPVVDTTNSTGADLHWRIQVELRKGPNQSLTPITDKMLEQPVQPLPQGYTAFIQTSSWQGEGEPRKGVVPTQVSEGKNIGKANATNAITQALRDALGLYNKHTKRAGLGTAAADTPGTTRPFPMLVKKIGETQKATLGPDDITRGVTAQRKYNGVRMVSCLGPGGQVEMYSRTAGDYLGMEPLRKELKKLIELTPEAILKVPFHEVYFQNVPERPRMHLDGELYAHGKSLREISGWARASESGSDLNYVIYDCFFPGLAAKDVHIQSRARQLFLDALFQLAAEKKIELNHVQRAENFPVKSLAHLKTLSKQFLREGYEGAIARKDWEIYQYGTNNYHSANLVKIKPVFDSEFPVTGYTQGTRGKEVGAVIWICEVPADKAIDPEDREFHVVPKNMSYADRYRIYKCLGEEVSPGLTRFDRDFKNKPLTVEYPELSTKTGKPTQPKALIFRTYEPKAGQTTADSNDPLAVLFTECD